MSRGRRRAVRTHRGPAQAAGGARRPRDLWLVIVGAVALIVAAAGVAVARHLSQDSPSNVAAFRPLPATPGSYLGVYEKDSPDS